MQKRRDARIGGGDQEVNRMLLNMRQLNIAEQEMLELANETSLLQEQKLALMKELNIELDKQDDTTTTTNLPTGGSPANTDADPVGDALKSGEFDLQESLLSIKQMFGDKEIETKADLNARLQEMQLIHLESMLEIEGLSAEQRMALEQRVADVKVKNRNNELDAADKLKEKEVDRIEQMKETESF